MKYLFLLIFSASAIFAQSGTNSASPADYKTQLENLTARKDALLKEKKTLKTEIGELTKELVTLSDANYRREICREYILKKYGKKNGNRILNGQVWKGMTEEMLRDSYGEPDKITRNKEKWGTFAQYYYGKQIFFFKNGKLFDWEQ
jgi:hypothetical protein